MNTIINLILLSCIVCYIEDCSGFIQSLKRQYLRKVMNMKNPDASILNLKPFDCSRCMTFWAGLIYLLCIGNFTIPYIALVSFLSLIASNISGFLLCIKDYLAALECWLQKLINN